MNIPDLDNLINAIECQDWHPSNCKNCPYNYQIFDDVGDCSFWTCDEGKISRNTLFYLKLYQYLIQEEKKNDFM